KRRQAGQHDKPNLPECQPVLDLRGEMVPVAAGLFARLPAPEKLRIAARLHPSPALRERVAEGGSPRQGEGLTVSAMPSVFTLILPAHRAGPLPLPQCRRGAIARA